MNCAECRDQLIARAEGLLDGEVLRRCEAHLEKCADCRAEYQTILNLQQHLIARGQAAAQVNVMDPVMRRVHQFKPERETFMSLILKHRWGFGLTATACAAALVIALLSLPNVHANAVDVLSKGAEAVGELSSIHLRGQIRTSPRDNFAFIAPNQDFVSIELWKQFEPILKWRVEKPGRVAVMDGKSTLLWIKPEMGYRVPTAATSAFDTHWFHQIAELNQTLENEVRAIKAKGWPVTLAAVKGADGKSKSVITIEAKAEVPKGDYLENQFIMTACTRRVYVFDDESELLEGAKYYLKAGAGETLIFELTQIEYNPTFAADEFQLQLPANVKFVEEMQILPDNAKYVALTSEQAARAFFEACGSENWTEVGKFMSPVTDRLKQYLTGVQIVKLGDHFTSATSAAWGGEFVPYEIKLNNGQVRKHNLALKRDQKTKRWFVDGGI